jgi:hypothetical protein
MLEPGDGLRLRLETAHERRIARDVLVHDPDDDLPADPRLGRPIQDAERSIAQALEEPVAAQGFSALV